MTQLICKQDLCKYKLELLIQKKNRNNWSWVLFSLNIEIWRGRRESSFPERMYPSSASDSTGILTREWITEDRFSRSFTEKLACMWGKRRGKIWAMEVRKGWLGTVGAEDVSKSLRSIKVDFFPIESQEDQAEFQRFLSGSPLSSP